ncbi:protein phosphatase CheZ [Magnetospira sp. QH-2]|uniref:protein phosphatase CheZ n=1 Tax=Magnetospira sp. (strain QH-2) TaxID=1288970 RepID=UPI0003E8112E|nr:protein phosphatase CheZ [Magnetospira sp. QH-2]CCQ74643.1 protein of unknown function [Magnetospira sp. QH-2]
MSDKPATRLFAAEKALLNHRTGLDGKPSEAPSPATLDQVMAELRALRSTVEQQSVGGQGDVDLLRGELYDLHRSIERTKSEISALNTTDHNPRQQLDAVIADTEKAAHRILEAAERISGEAEKMLEKAKTAEITEGLEHIVAETVAIFEASYFQDVGGQRIRKVIDFLEYFDQRLATMIHIWGAQDFDQPQRRASDRAGDDKAPDADLLNGPQLDGEGMNQEDIDALFD